MQNGLTVKVAFVCNVQIPRRDYEKKKKRKKNVKGEKTKKLTRAVNELDVVV